MDKKILGNIDKVNVSCYRPICVNKNAYQKLGHFIIFIQHFVGSIDL